MKTRRIGMSLFGVIICAISVGIFKIAAMGVDPFQSLMGGLHQWIPISFGTLYTIVNAVLLLFGLAVEKKNIGIATFINLFLLGYITEYSYAFLERLLPNPGIWTRIVCLLLGIVILCLGSAFYMTADLGVSTYDAIAIIFAYKWKIGKFQYCRITTDVICVAAGTIIFLLAGGSLEEIKTIVGVGTIITAFFMGPLIEVFNERITRPMLKAGSKEQH